MSFHTLWLVILERNSCPWCSQIFKFQLSKWIVQQSNRCDFYLFNLICVTSLSARLSGRWDFPLHIQRCLDHVSASPGVHDFLLSLLAVLGSHLSISGVHSTSWASSVFRLYLCIFGIFRCLRPHPCSIKCWGLFYTHTAVLRILPCSFSRNLNYWYSIILHLYTFKDVGVASGTFKAVTFPSVHRKYYWDFICASLRVHKLTCLFLLSSLRISDSAKVVWSCLTWYSGFWLREILARKTKVDIWLRWELKWSAGGTQLEVIKRK